MSDRINLIVPFSQKDEAKSKGAKWDAKNKTWHVLEGVDLNDFYKWLPDNIPNLRAKNYSLAETEMTCWKCKKQTLYTLYI
ncbi:DUF5710 domain-containing protein [Neobacillus sp. OS1-2]|uniref:DUF5710 domain-containing protein n=1 Tax=Neobacillus sp. OS1-2 TaxID=3070680 RepID=UPI0027E0B08D|nr:DUF5710 domain-containing protein [Neobacillus sp. OS1-2]WML42004.1 DUF5710 domain-containing protein [Neobacillus sp. OS1-2]